MIRPILLALLMAAVAKFTVAILFALQSYTYDLQGEELVRSVICRGEMGNRKSCTREELCANIRAVHSHSLTSHCVTFEVLKCD